ncbi:hypothetical protein J6590_042084 [Homalodisca vitripennis]|nr:hypothetical protein J6590_042084 [Homalodisca vitripennis]
MLISQPVFTDGFGRFPLIGSRTIRGDPRPSPRRGMPQASSSVKGDAVQLRRYNVLWWRATVSDMVVCLWVWQGLVAAATALVVIQPDGIVSIITELEEDKTPVAYLQAVDKSQSRTSPIVFKTPAPPLEHGEFRVSSGKIRVVDPDSGFQVVHPSSELDGSGKFHEIVQQRSGSQAETSPRFKVVYPAIIPEGLANHKDLRKDSIHNKNLNGVLHRRKVGKYGNQTPRRENTVRTEKTTRIRNNNEPAKVYKHTIVRPVSEDDEVGRPRKYGKAGRYGKYVTQTPFLRPTLGVGEVIDSSDIGSEVSANYDPSRHKTKKEYSSKTVTRYPDGYEQGNERRIESSSKFRTGSKVKNNYKTPVESPPKDVRKHFDVKTPSSINEQLDPEQPVQEATSLLGSGPIEDLDDGLVGDTGGAYIGKSYGGGVQDYGGYGGYVGGIDKGNNYEQEKGKGYVAAHNSAHGAKGQKGHNHEEGYSKGKSEQHAQDEDKGYSVEKGGDTKSHLDKTSQYAAGHQASEGAKGSDFHKEKGHKKGHKKSGFRTVHHKDEYKRNEEFYDEEHTSGDEKHQGHKTQEHLEKSGGEDEKSHLDSGNHQESHGHEGGHEKGQGHTQQKGYQKEKGHSGHYGNEEEYGKKSGHSEGETHGHSGHGGLGHGYH